MKFQNILLFFAAATFAFASSVDISDDEDIIVANDQSIESDLEIVDKVPSIKEDNVLLSDDEKPNEKDEEDNVIDEDKDNNEKVKDDAKDDVVVDTNKKPKNENEKKKPTKPQPAKTEEKPEEKQEESDADIPEPNKIPAEPKDEVPVAVDDDNGEGSDDYGDVNGVDALDGGESSEADKAAAEPVAPKTIDKETKKETQNAKTIQPATKSEESDDDSEGEPVVPYAAGVAGAAFLSSAGIIFWLKRSKRNTIDDAPMDVNPVRMESLV